MSGIIFDDAMNASVNVKALELSKSLSEIIKSLEAPQSAYTALLKENDTITAGNRIIADLMRLSANARGVSLQVNDDPAIPLQTQRQDTSPFYHFEDVNSVGKVKRQNQNNAAYELVQKFENGELSPADITDEQRIILGKYSGNGGGLKDNRTGQKGSAFEYYTPVPIASGIWDALKEMGFNGGKVLDPCGGTGVFGATAPLSAAVDAVELDPTSGAINKLMNESDSYSVQISNFEAVASNTPEEVYDAVVSNVPFGDDREGNQFQDSRYQKEPLENYFILRSLDKLKPNGLAAFIVPPRCVDGRDKKASSLRFQASLKAEFLGAYRLPNKVFGAASADTITDVIFFRKFSRTAAEKINELRESKPAVLSESNVLWDRFLDGKYFNTAEGIKHILGEFIPKDPEKFRDVNRVTNPASIPDIAKMMRKLPKSRINWALMDETETDLISYNEGDTIAQDGRILKMVGGEWVVISSHKQDGNRVTQSNLFTTALSAFTNNLTYDQLRDYSAYLTSTAQYSSASEWLTQAERSLEKLSIADRSEAFKTFVVGLAVLEALDNEGRTSGVNFLAEYPELSDAMKTHSALLKKHKPKGLVKQGLDAIGFHYTRKGGYSNLWKGEVAAIEDNLVLTPDASFEGLIYKNKSPWVSLDDAKAIFGADFDPYTNEDWCVRGDGQMIIRADDYFVGNYADMLSHLDLISASAKDEKLKSKLLQQKELAHSRVQVVDVNKMRFNIRSPYITPEERIEFLKIYIDSSATIEEVGKQGKEKVKFNFKDSDVKSNFNLKLYRRFAEYIESGNASLGSADFDGEEARAIKDLRTLIATTNEQFHGWVRSNKRITERLNAVANDPQKQHFIQADDESPLVIQGMNPALTLHGYQNSFVRKMSRSFEGINGFDVGLGKTFTSLASVQYVQSIGVKKKTLFVVPNSVLSNWHKEAKNAYSSIDDCLFVGLREVDGRMTSSSSLYDIDLQRVLENNHSKIFLTMEAFERIKLKDETINDFESYLRKIDQSFAENEDRKKDSKAKGKALTLIQILVGKTGSAPYLEDMGIDSIVIDEAHSYKNSSEAMDFKGGKYLSVSKSSGRGMDAQAKSWYIRGKQEKGDGVLLLTATPITNSPLEIYSMLSLAVGHGRVNDMAIGTNGADGFMGAVCRMVNEEEEGIDGSLRDMQVFKGLINTDMLQKSINQVATIKDAKMVGKSIYVPEANDMPTDVALPDDVIQLLTKYKNAYRFASALAADKPVPDVGEEDYQEMKDRFDEEDDVLGHPFNLIRKMTNLIVDPDLDQMLSSYIFVEADRKEMTKVVDAWNAKKPTEDWGRLTPNTLKSDIVSTKTTKNQTSGKETVSYKVGIRAWIDDNKVCINSTNWETQEKLEKAMEKAKIDTDVAIPAKLAAMLANFKDECAKPRGVVRGADGKEMKLPYAKQIIFCDMLGMHNKIRKLLAKHAGISAGKIVIVTGQRNNDPAELLDVQDGFNAVENNKYQVIIANEKAEVGINLQNGTQANHHLTIGWTPDSLQQRNGRSARQGNLTDQVKSYFYDAEGTFDVAKRTLVNNKAEWISNLVSNDDGADVEITGGMSKQHMDALIDNIGNADAINSLQDQLMQADKATRIEQNRFNQRVNINTILKENKYLSQNKSVTDWVAKLMGELLNKHTKIDAIQKRIDNPEATLTAIAKNQKSLDSVKIEIDVMTDYIGKAVIFREGSWDQQSQSYIQKGDSVFTAKDLIDSFLMKAKNGEKSSDYMVSDIKDGRAGYKNIIFDVSENSELKDDWQSAIEMSDSIRKNAAIAYEEQANKEGAYTKDVSNALIDGQASLVGDVILTRDSFLVLNEDPSQEIYPIGRAFKGYKAKGLIGGTEKVEHYIDSMLSDQRYTVAYPNTALHAKCLAYLAQYEDGLYALGDWDNSSYFTKDSPIISTQKATDTVRKYGYDYLLPFPHFGRVEKPSDVLSTMNVRRHIHKLQQSVIKRFDEYSYWVDIDIECEYQGYRDTDKINLQYRDYAVAHNMRLSLDDLQKYSDSSFILKGMRDSESYSEDRSTEIISQAQSVNELDESLITYLESCLTWFDFRLGDLSNILPFGLSYPYRNKKRSFEVVEAAPQPIVVENTNVAPEPSDTVEVGLETHLIVRVTGSGTKDNKDRLKELGKEWCEDHSTFKQPSNWGNKGFKWNKPALAWEIPKGAWLRFKEQYPSQLSSLNAEVYN